MTVAITYNETLKSVLIAHGGLDNLCRIRKIDDIHTVDEIALSQGYTAEIMFIHDNSNRVIFGSGDSNVYIYNYILKTHLLTIDAPKGDVVDIDYFIDDILNLLIIGISSCDGYFYIVSIDNKKMEIINIDSIQISMADINCIAFSPNQQYIACDGDDGICTILRRNDKKNKYEYYIVITKKITNHGNEEYDGLTKCCWLDLETLIIGTNENGQILNVLKICTMIKNKECIDIIASFMDKIEYLAQLIVEFCGYDIQTASIKTIFEDNTRITGIKSLTDYNVCPGIFCVSSWDKFSCLYIPIK
eukprot:299829_1